MNKASSGEVITVTGPMKPEEIGLTLMHEHVIWDMRELMSSNVDEDPLRVVTVDNAAELRWDPYSIPDNYLLDDVDIAVQELSVFADAGGRTIVDCTPSRYRDPDRLRTVAERSGINIIMGGGHYLEKSHPPHLIDQPLEAIAQEVIDEVRHGVGEMKVKPGIIGEIGTGAPVTKQEERVLRAMAWAQQETGLPITVHVHPWGKQGHHVLDILLSEGVGVDRMILNHAFVDVDDPSYEESLLARGVTLGYDMFGFDHALFRVGRYPPTDFDVAAEVARLVRIGYSSQLILSQDVCVKTRLVTFGGWGYKHIPQHIVPLLREFGVDEEHLSQMLEGNPRRLLTVR